MLNPVKLGLSGGIVWGASLFLFTIISMYTGYSAQFLSIFSEIYPGYAVSWWGSLIGLIYGFIDAFVGLYVLAWLYNKL